MQIARNLARSFENGIVFYSTVFNNKALKVFYDENDTIKMENVTDEYEATVVKDKNYKETKKRYMKQAGVLSVILICLAIALTQNVHWVLAAIFFSLYTSYDVIAFYHMVKHVRKKDEKGRSIAKFHSAEHKVINAYLRYGRVPTFEEIKAESCLSSHCGSLMIIRKIVYFIIISLLLPVCSINVILYILLLIGLVFWMIILREKPGMLKIFEYFFLDKPTDVELKLALVGIEEYEKLEAEAVETMMEEHLQNFDGIVVRVVFRSENPKSDIEEN